MAVENRIAIRSTIEAVVTARKAVAAQKSIPISPCVQKDSSEKEITCPKLDQTLATLCKDPDGLIPDRGVLQCPMQKGNLVLRR